MKIKLKKVVTVFVTLICLFAFSSCNRGDVSGYVQFDYDLPTYYDAQKVENEKTIRFATWQEAYASILHEYMNLPPDWTGQISEIWHFMLHDIDKDGIPELFLMAYMPYSGKVMSDRTFAFIDGQAKQINQSTITGRNIGYFAPDSNSSHIVFYMYEYVNVGGFYRRTGGSYSLMEIIEFEITEDHGMGFTGKHGFLSTVISGFFNLNEAGIRELEIDPRNFDGEDLKWFDLHASANFVWVYQYAPHIYHDFFVENGSRQLTIAEFERMFGCRNERIMLTPTLLAEENIESVILSQ